MKVEIVKFDNRGFGIGYLNDKIIFVPKSIPGDIVNVEIVLEKKNYYFGKVIDIVLKSKMRKKSICPYFDKCGGCDLMHISLSDTLEYKLNKVNEILKKNNIDYKVLDIIKSDNNINYRNKVTVKIINGELGYFENDTHNLINIDYCYLCNDSINNLIKDIKELNIINGLVIIRTNYKNEILLIIETENNLNNYDKLINNHKIVGIIKNNKCIYGENYFFDKVNDYLFKVSYNSFFQINPYICSKLFDLVKEYSKKCKNILDLYCGVGTLSLVSSNKNNFVLGVEIAENAIKDANLNKNINKCDNVEFRCDDTKNIIDKITSNYDLVLLDPPRSGVNINVLNKIMEVNTQNIIYVSCDPFTLVRDLKLLLDKYEIVEFKLLDMFSWTEHVESFVVLKHK